MVDNNTTGNITSAVTTNTINIPYLGQTEIFLITIFVIVLFIGLIIVLIWKIGDKYMDTQPEARPNLFINIALILIILIVIIFGLNRVLNTENITALLAAIAGYVLGRSQQPKSSDQPVQMTPEEAKEMAKKYIVGNETVGEPSLKDVNGKQVYAVPVIVNDTKTREILIDPQTRQKL